MDDGGVVGAGGGRGVVCVVVPGWLLGGVTDGESMYGMRHTVLVCAVL